MKMQKTLHMVHNAILMSLVFGLTCLMNAGATAQVNVKYTRLEHSGFNMIQGDNFMRHWNLVVPAALDNQVLLYSREGGAEINGVKKGQGKLLTFHADGTFTQYNHWSDWENTWDQIIRGQFGGSPDMDFLFYNRAEGRVLAVEIDRYGNYNHLFDQVIGSEWDILVAGQWGDPNYSDLAAYSRTEGILRFYKMNVAKNKFVTVRTGSMQKIWDQIVPGQFTSGSRTELLLYNMDGGNAKFVAVDGAYSLSTFKVERDWPLTESLAIVPGEFGGNELTDLLVYEQNKGEATLRINQGAGVFQDLWKQNSWRKFWVQIVPVKQISQSHHDLFFYENLHRIPMVAVQVADRDGSNRAPITVDEVREWLTVANKVFAPAGIELTFNGQFVRANNTSLNQYNCKEESDESKKAAQDWSDYLGGDQRVIVFFRNYSGGGCSSSRSKYVIMPHFNAQRGGHYYNREGKKTDRFGNLDDSLQHDSLRLLAHELGHYFGLSHTFFGDVQGAVDSVYDLDTDRGANLWSRVFDTAPTPEYWAIHYGDANPSDDSLEFDALSKDGTPILTKSGHRIRINPERHNVMSYGPSCDLTYRLSPDQIKGVRRTIYEKRRALIE